MSAVSGVLCFWVPLALTLYHWFGYPVLLILLSAIRRDKSVSVPGQWPSVSIVVAVYNEELNVADKVRNSLAVDYPRDRIEILFGSDASTDSTESIISSFTDPRIRLVRLPERGGKAAVLNALTAEVRGDLVLLTDADVLLAADAVRLMAQRFSDPEVGVVQANYRRENRSGSASEGLFDLWETTVKRLEGRLGAMTSANGWGMMLRRGLFKPIPPDTVHDDLLLGIRPFRDGFRAVYETRAVVTCRVEAERIEFRRRVKMGRGNVQALVREIDLLSPKYGIQALALFSHKVLRTILPVGLPFVLAGAAIMSSEPFYRAALVVQLLSYLTIPLLMLAGVRWRRFLFPQYYLLMNIALLCGAALYALGPRQKHWERTPR